MPVCKVPWKSLRVFADVSITAVPDDVSDFDAISANDESSTSGAA
jgi:hypothetical protein